jgi:hypothetical protein
MQKPRKDSLPGQVNTAVLKETHGEEFSNRFRLGFSAIDQEEIIRRFKGKRYYRWINRKPPVKSEA